MLKLQRALEQMTLWIAVEAVSARLCGQGDMKRVRGIDKVIDEHIEKYTQGNWEITVEEFVDYDNKDLSVSGFKRQEFANDGGWVMYLLPTVIYPLMPSELVVYASEDTQLSKPLTMEQVIKSYGEGNTMYGIVVQEDGTDTVTE